MTFGYHQISEPDYDENQISERVITPMIATDTNSRLDCNGYVQQYQIVVEPKLELLYY